MSKNFIRAAVEGNEQGGKGGRRQAARWAWWRRTIFGISWIFGSRQMFTARTQARRGLSEPCDVFL